MNLKEKIETLQEVMVNVMFPRRCPICDRAIRPREITCHECKGGVKTIQGDTCFKCGKSLLQDNEIYCYDCKKSPRYFERGFAVFQYDYIKSSLYRFKYSARPEYASFYARVTVDKLGMVINQIKPQAFVPVPVHKSRYRKRGYNQAYEYASCLSKLTGIPINDKLIARAKKTLAQKELTPVQRQKNLKKAFKLCSYGVKLQRVCVIDDIYTTGSTINAVTLLLKQAGIKEVYFISIAIGKGY